MPVVNVKDPGGAGMDLLEVDGYRICTFAREPQLSEQIVRNIPNLECRDDDVFLLAPVKSGTHWTWELACMLQNGQAETIPRSKVCNMLEHTTFDLSGMVSPRILNSHLKMSLLPKQLFEKRCKVVHVLRDPKDTITSWYHHCKGLADYKYDGTFADFLKLVYDDELEYGSMFDYIKGWEDFTKANPTYPVHVMYYEDLHKNNKEEIKKLSTFLGIEASDKLIDDISQKCHITNMVKDKQYPEEIHKLVFKGDFSLYRKGVVGDWKNMFTVAQSREFDRVFTDRMAGTKYAAVYKDYIIS